MKPFNLTEALKGATVVTKAGNIVTELHLLGTATNMVKKLVVVIDGTIFFYHDNGKCYESVDSLLDLYLQ